MQNYQTTLLLVLALVHMLVATELGDNYKIIEGDILINTAGINAVWKPAMLWPDGRVPYQFNATINDTEKAIIKKAMLEYEKKTCIRFVEKNEKDEDFVHILDLKRCSSELGRRKGKQILSLGKGCFYHSTIVHEFCHTIGFDHEQNRSDRDKYVEIQWDAIIEDKKDNFEKRNSSEEKLIDKFDFNSVMLYSDTAFSKDKKTKTIIPKDPNKKLQRVGGLSDADVEKIKKLYGCK